MTPSNVTDHDTLQTGQIGAAVDFRDGTTGLNLDDVDVADIPGAFVQAGVIITRCFYVGLPNMRSTATVLALLASIDKVAAGAVQSIFSIMRISAKSSSIASCIACADALASIGLPERPPAARGILAETSKSSSTVALASEEFSSPRCLITGTSATRSAAT